MQKWRALLPLLLVGTAAQPIFTAFEHVAADPCAANLPTSAASDCSTGLPLTSVTYFYDPVPIVAGTTTVTVYGKNLASATFGVSLPAGSCSAPVPLFGGAPFNANPAGTSIILTVDQTTKDTLASLLLGHETAPVKLCWIPSNGNGPAARYTGVTFARATRCTSAAGSCAANFAAIPFATAAQNALLRLQTSCCLAPVVVGSFVVSSCINPNTQACCGGIPYNPNVEKCCSWNDPSITAPSRTIFRVSALSAACPCFSTADCSREGSTESSCCLPSKYTELALSTTQASGQCFNPSIHRCCNTGMRYEPGSQQCCAINGIQSVNVPCPCAVDQDCWGGQTAGGPTAGNQIVPSTPSPRLSQFVCCKQTAPPPLEAERCNIYTNFPSGTGSYRNQRCNGQCIDSTYQICCNGAICRREFEQCCNATCCNLYVGTCGTGLRSGGAGVAPANWREFGLAYEVCTTVEQLSTVKSFWVFILPSFLLLGTLIVFALGIVFVHKAATRQFLVIERLLIAFAVASILLACPLYFAPVYKYGIITVIVAVFEILVAAAPFKGFRILGVIVAGFLLLYLFDPFHGNHYLNLASGRTQSGNPDPETAGVWYTTGKSWRNITNAASTANHCVQWYGGYFRYDPLLQDYDRFSNPHISTFGYCGRGWVTTLLVVEGALLFATSVMFLCALLAAILPFKVAYDPIELEVRGTGSVLEYTR